MNGANPAPANPERGEAALNVAGESLTLRPSFGALVAAEGELGSLFALVERAAVSLWTAVGWRWGLMLLALCAG